MELPTNVFEYLKLPTERKIELFFLTNTATCRPANYYINFDSSMAHIDSEVLERVKKLKDLETDSIENLISFFKCDPEMVKLVPVLLAFRLDSQLREVNTLSNAEEDYMLDFKDPNATLDFHLRFLRESGLAKFLVDYPTSNFIDLVRGIEIGLNSNARKNRGGKLGEAFLSQAMLEFADRGGQTDETTTSEFLFTEQGTKKSMEKVFSLDLTNMDIPSNRRFDGAVYRQSRDELTLIEVNFFNSIGSKMKAAAGEFSKLQDTLKSTSSRFIYITAGKGWARDRSHISAAIKDIDYLFNFEMVKQGYVRQLVTGKK